MSQQAGKTNAPILVLLSDVKEQKDQEGPLVPKMWSNSVRMSSTA